MNGFLLIFYDMTTSEDYHRKFVYFALKIGKPFELFRSSNFVDALGCLILLIRCMLVGMNSENQGFLVWMNWYLPFGATTYDHG